MGGGVGPIPVGGGGAIVPSPAKPEPATELPPVTESAADGDAHSFCLRKANSLVLGTVPSEEQNIMALSCLEKRFALAYEGERDAKGYQIVQDRLSSLGIYKTKTGYGRYDDYGDSIVINLSSASESNVLLVASLNLIIHYYQRFVVIGSVLIDGLLLHYQCLEVDHKVYGAVHIARNASATDI
ncbi:hypothetical protein Tco_1145455 [Tanacetum coccineum]